jgi:hypothetical protein
LGVSIALPVLRRHRLQQLPEVGIQWTVSRGARSTIRTPGVRLEAWPIAKIAGGATNDAIQPNILPDQHRIRVVCAADVPGFRDGIDVAEIRAVNPAAVLARRRNDVPKRSTL